MAVAIVTDITGRDGSRDVDSNKRYRRTWLVRTTSPQDGASVVLAAPGIPAFNTVYTYLDDSNPALPVSVEDTEAVVVDIKASQDNPNDPQDWRVVVEYAGVGDPVAQPADVEYSPTRYQKALVVDLDNKPLVNSANDPFESGMMVDRTRFTLTIAKNVLTWDPVAMLAFQDSVNLSPFLSTVHPPGFLPGTCKLNLAAKRMRRKGTNNFFWHRTAVIDIDRAGWKTKIRDAGFREAIRDPLDPSIIIDHRPIQNGGVPVSSPVLLKDGLRLARGVAVPAPLEFRGYDVMNWVTLGLEYGADS